MKMTKVQLLYSIIFILLVTAVIAVDCCLTMHNTEPVKTLKQDGAIRYGLDNEPYLLIDHWGRWANPKESHSCTEGDTK